MTILCSRGVAVKNTWSLKAGVRTRPTSMTCQLNQGLNFSSSDRDPWDLSFPTALKEDMVRAQCQLSCTGQKKKSAHMMAHILAMCPSTEDI